MLKISLLQKWFLKRYQSHLSKLKKYKTLKQANIHPFSTNRPATHAPIILGSSNTRMSILILGEIMNEPHFYNSHFLYPLGYTCKRKYRTYRSKLPYKSSINPVMNNQTKKISIELSGQNIPKIYSNNLDWITKVEDSHSANYKKTSTNPSTNTGPLQTNPVSTTSTDKTNPHNASSDQINQFRILLSKPATDTNRSICHVPGSPRNDETKVPVANSVTEMPKSTSHVLDSAETTSLPPELVTGPPKSASHAPDSDQTKSLPPVPASGTAKSDEKIFYCMTIHENGCLITTDDKEWKNWSEFVHDFDQSSHENNKNNLPTFSSADKLDGMSFEEFFGFTNLQLQRILERNMYTKYKNGISGYVGYHKE